MTKEKGFQKGADAHVDRESKDLTLVAIAAISLLILAHLAINNPDDLGVKWAANPDSAMAENAFRNFRFIPSAVHLLIAKLHSTYFHIVATWSVLFAVGLYACVNQFAAYIGMRKNLTPWLFLCVSLQSYWSDVYPFGLAHMHFALSLLFMSGCLYTLRICGPRRSVRIIVASIFGFFSLCSYQPIIFLLVFAPTLALFDSSLKRHIAIEEVRHEIVDAVLTLGISFAALALTVKLLPLFGYNAGPTDRVVGIEQVIQNFPTYLTTIFDPFLSIRNNYLVFVPLHERVIFGLAILLSLTICASSSQRFSVKLALLALLIVSIATLPDPLNLPGKVFWPTPRSMVGASFFFVFLTFILATSWIRRGRLTILCDATIVCLGLFSLGNQVYALSSQYDQSKRDDYTALQIIADIRQITKVSDQTKLAIFSSWRNPAQRKDQLLFEFNLSAFSVAWSKFEILENTLGFHLVRGNVPASSCEQHASPWEVRLIGDTVVVCMD